MNLFDVYSLFDIEPVRGEGSYVFTEDGTRYPLRGICSRENIVCLPKLKTPFFPKELEVAKYFAQGYVAREIAQILGKSRNTVSAQLRKMTKRLGLESTRDIIKVVHQLNL